jgi:hypothetical protein
MYTTTYFIEKFSAIAEERWTVRTQQDDYGRRCAFGHCMSQDEIRHGRHIESYGHETDEGEALSILFLNAGIRHASAHCSGVTAVNNGEHPKYRQHTPKERILAALYDIKAGEAVQEVRALISEPGIVQSYA